MTAEKLFYESEEYRGTYYDNFISYDVPSVESIDLYYDNLIEYNVRKKQRLDAHIGIMAARKRIVRIVLIAVVMSVLFSITIALKSDITSREVSIMSLTAQVESLSRENTDRKKRLNDNTNILSIKQKALDLGMDYAGKDAVVYYSIGKDDYMRSYCN